MATKLICGSILAVALLGCLANAWTKTPNNQRKNAGQSHTQTNTQSSYSTHRQSAKKSSYDSIDVCTVEQADRVGCGQTGISQDDCLALDCCYGNTGCYFGRQATLHCNRDAVIILAVARDVTIPSIDVDRIAFLSTGSRCSPHISPAFVVFQFSVTECGTTVTENSDSIIYENIVSAPLRYDGDVDSPGIITRDAAFSVGIKCTYTRNSIEAVIFEPLPLPAPTSVVAFGNWEVELRLGSGECTTKGCIEDEAAYTSFYSEFPVAKELRNSIYVEIRILRQTDPDLVLNLGRCWANNSPMPGQYPQWDLLINGCPNPDDSYLTRLIPVDPSVELSTHYKRFVFQMFTFVNNVAADPINQYTKSDPQSSPPATPEPSKEMVYIHCDCSVCVGPANCQQSCSRRKRAVVTTKQTAPTKITVSSPAIRRSS